MKFLCGPDEAPVGRPTRARLALGRLLVPGVPAGIDSMRQGPGPGDGLNSGPGATRRLLSQPDYGEAGAEARRRGSVSCSRTRSISLIEMGFVT
jgi:hypothetical protein